MNTAWILLLGSMALMALIVWGVLRLVRRR